MDWIGDLNNFKLLALVVDVDVAVENIDCFDFNRVSWNFYIDWELAYISA